MKAVNGRKNTVMKSWGKVLGAGLLFVLTTACSEQQFSLEPAKQEFGQQVTYNTEVDVLMVVDNSGSMQPRQDLLAAQMPSFLGALDATKLNYRISVISMDMSGSGDGGRFKSDNLGPAVLSVGTPNLVSILQSRIKMGETGSPITRGLESLKASLSAPNTDFYNAGFLRKDSLLVVIFLTDEDDQSALIDYGAWLDKIKPPLPYGDRSWLAHFIGVLPNDKCSTTPGWNYKEPGLRFIDLVTRSGGIQDTICNPDFRQTMTNVRARMLELLTEYKLDRKPQPDTITVLINGQLVPKDPVNGWQYNAERNSIRFYGTAVPPVGATISIDFAPGNLTL